MQVTARELKTRCDELVKRAAAGEEIVITSRGIAQARMVPVEHFDPERQERVLANMVRLRDQLARGGTRVTLQQIKKARDEGRR